LEEELPTRVCNKGPGGNLLLYDGATLHSTDATLDAVSPILPTRLFVCLLFGGSLSVKFSSFNDWIERESNGGKMVFLLLYRASVLRPYSRRSGQTKKDIAMNFWDL